MPTDDYIKRSDALKAILGVSIYDTIGELEGARTIAENTWADGLYDAYKIIDEEVDAADVEPARRGRWIPINRGNPQWVQFGIPQAKCSACGHETMTTTPYCPNCGAKMDKEEVHENQT